MCCGNSRRAARCGGVYGASNQYARPRGGLVMGLIEGVQQMRLVAQQQALATQQQALAAPAPGSAPYSIAPQAANFGTQTRGVVYPVTDNDEKKSMSQEESIDYEELPTYEEAANTENSGATVARAALTKSAEAPYMPTNVKLPQNISQSVSPTSLNEFDAALAEYRQRECGGRCRAKRAARDLLRELAEREAARLQETCRPVSYAQRKQIRKDLAPVKTILKAAIREARRE